MGTDVGSLMIECSVTICDGLNSSVGSTQLLWIISNLLQQRYQYTISNQYEYTYTLPNIAHCLSKQFSHSTVRAYRAFFSDFSNGSGNKAITQLVSSLHNLN